MSVEWPCVWFVGGDLSDRECGWWMGVLMAVRVSGGLVLEWPDEWVVGECFSGPSSEWSVGA